MPKSTLDREPRTTSWIVNDFAKGKRFTRNCSAKVTDMKSANDPVSISARAGWPSICTVTTTGRGMVRVKSQVIAALHCNAVYPDFGSSVLQSSTFMR